MSSSKGTRKRVIKSFHDFLSFYFNKQPKAKSTLIQHIMLPSDTSSRSSSNAFSSLGIRRDRRVSQVHLRPDREERIVCTPPQRSSPALTQGPIATFQSLTVASQNRTRMQARNHPCLTNFGPYKDSSINDQRKLPFDIQHSVSFQIFILLEGAIFDFTKQWAPEYLAKNNFSSAKQVELNFWNRFQVAPIIPPDAFEDHNIIPRYHELLDRFREIRHTYVHRKEPPVLYVEQMLEDAREVATIIGDTTRAQKLDKIYQVMRFMGSILRGQITNMAKTRLEDRLQAGRRARDMRIDWLEANRLQKEEMEIKRDLNHDTAGFEALYVDALKGLEDMMQLVSDFLAG